MKVSVAEVKNKLPELIKAVEDGESVTIWRRGTPVADLVRTATAGEGKRKFGTLQGKIVEIDPNWWKPTADEEVDDLLEGRPFYNAWQAEHRVMRLLAPVRPWFTSTWRRRKTTFWVQRQTSTTLTAGTVVTINDTAPTADRYNLSLCEILLALWTSTLRWRTTGAETLLRRGPFLGHPARERGRIKTGNRCPGLGDPSRLLPHHSCQGPAAPT